MVCLYAKDLVSRKIRSFVPQDDKPKIAQDKSTGGPQSRTCNNHHLARPAPVVIKKYLRMSVFGVRFAIILITDEDSFILRITQPSLSCSPGCEKHLLQIIRFT